MSVTPRNQPALPLELRPERPARLSQTWLSHYEKCKHSALLYTRYRGATTSPEMERGSLFHEVVARLTNDAIEHGWETVPHEIAKAALFEVFAEGGFTVPSTEWDHVRRCVFQWAENTKLQPDKIIGVEQLVVMDIAGWRISGKLDLIFEGDTTTTLVIRDYKTARSALTKEQFEQSWQQKIYALLAAYGQPVTISECDCRGLTGGDATDCPTCGGKDYIETLEPYPLGSASQHFDIAEVYPALAFEDGGLMERGRIMSRAELLDERSMLEALLAQVTHSFDSGEWPAVPSDDACSKCPARRDCPLPDQLLPFTAIETPEDAEHYAMAAELLDLERKAIQKALKAWVKSEAPVDLGNGTRLNFVPVEVNETDYKGYREAVAAGRVVELDEFKSTRIQTSFKAEPIPEPSPDEKWGDDAPWVGSDLSEGQAA